MRVARMLNLSLVAIALAAAPSMSEASTVALTKDSSARVDSLAYPSPIVQTMRASHVSQLLDSSAVIDSAAVSAKLEASRPTPARRHRSPLAPSAIALAAIGATRARSRSRSTRAAPTVEAPEPAAPPVPAEPTAVELEALEHRKEHEAFKTSDNVKKTGAHDRTVPGGRYIGTDGEVHNANGEIIEE